MNSAAGRAFAVFALVAALTFGAVTYGGYQIVVQSREQSQSNGQLLRILLAVSGCTTVDTPEACRQRQVDRAAAEGVARVADVECRIRRALADEPSPPPGERCVPPAGK